MTDRKQKLLDEIRYAERITQRTARLYRRMAAFFTFCTVLGGSGAITALSAAVPAWVGLAGTALLAVAGAASLAMRPTEKATANEADARKYAALRTQALAMDDNQLDAALQKARETDVPEVELLREVAYNDLAREVGRPDYQFKLTLPQRLLGALA